MSRWFSRRSGVALALAVLVAALTLANGRLIVLMLDSERRFETMGDEKAALHARQLVHNNDWATLSTISRANDGMPFGNVVSYADGIGKSAKNSTGELFFYLTTLDSTGQDLEADARASVTISLAQEGPHACKRDTEDPTCWKLTILGKVQLAPKDKQKFALDALFSRHPDMSWWPQDHGFNAYVMNIEKMILLDYYGGPKTIKPEDYYKIKLE